jgi:hypothetical protein
MKKSVTLLDWINQAGNSSLEQVADSCYRSDIIFIKVAGILEIPFFFCTGTLCRLQVSGAVGSGLSGYS